MPLLHLGLLLTNTNIMIKVMYYNIHSSNFSMSIRAVYVNVLNYLMPITTNNIKATLAKRSIYQTKLHEHYKLCPNAGITYLLVIQILSTEESCLKTSSPNWKMPVSLLYYNQAMCMYGAPISCNN